MTKLSDYIKRTLIPDGDSFTGNKYLVRDETTGEYLESAIRETDTQIITTKEFVSKAGTIGIGPVIKLKDNAGLLEVHNTLYDSRVTQAHSSFDHIIGTDRDQPVHYHHMWGRAEAVIQSDSSLKYSEASVPNFLLGRVHFNIRTSYIPYDLVGQEYRYRFASDSKGVRLVIKLGNAETGVKLYETYDEDECARGIGQDVLADNPMSGTINAINGETVLSISEDHTHNRKIIAGDIIKIESDVVDSYEEFVVVNITPTQITIDAPYIGTTNNTANLWNTITNLMLPTDVALLKDSQYHFDFTNNDNDVDMYGAIGKFGEPDEFSPWIYRAFQYRETFSVITNAVPVIRTGATIESSEGAECTIAKGSSIVNGNDKCNFLTSFASGQSFELIGEYFTVEMVLSDTQLITTNPANKSYIDIAIYTTPDLFGVENVAGTRKLTIDKVGNLSSMGDRALLPGPKDAPSDENFENGQWTMWVDEVYNEFELKAKKSDGSIITKTIGSGGLSYSLGITEYATADLQDADTLHDDVDKQMLLDSDGTAIVWGNVNKFGLMSIDGGESDSIYIDSPDSVNIDMGESHSTADDDDILDGGAATGGN